MKLKKDRTPFDVFPSYKGGHTVLHGGYVHEFSPYHPSANVWGWVPQHRLVGEDIVGRPLIQSTKPSLKECVHHKNEIKTDNRPENLEVMTFSAHRSHHAKEINNRRAAHLNAQSVAQALKESGSIFDAAAKFGVHHQTLRNLFPDTVKPYLRSSPFDASHTKYKEQLVEVAKYFAPTQMSYAELAKLTCICMKTWRAICTEHDFVWVKGPSGGLGSRLVYQGQPTAYAKKLYGSSIEAGDERLRTVAERKALLKASGRRGKNLTPFSAPLT